MAEDKPQQQQQQQESSSSSSKQGKRQGREGQKRGPGLAPIQGEYTDDRPAHRKPGTREHLGDDDPVYGGEPKLMGGETEEDARNR
jgi:hypothetical protein